MTRRIKFTLFYFLLVIQCMTSLLIGAEESELWNTWYLVLSNGRELGWWHSLGVECLEDGQTRIKNITTSRYGFQKQNKGYPYHKEITSLEDDQGRLIEAVRIEFKRNEIIRYDLVVGAGVARIMESNGELTYTHEIRWEEEVLGPARVDTIFKTLNKDPDSERSLVVFDLEEFRPVEIVVNQGDPVEKTLLEGEKKRLVPVTTRYSTGGSFTSWLDAESNVLAISNNEPDSPWERYRTTEKRAKNAEGSALAEEDLGRSRSNVILPSPFLLESIHYRLSFSEPLEGFPQKLEDSRQKIVHQEDRACRVHICVDKPEQRQARPVSDISQDLWEYLQPNAMVQSDHPQLTARALEIVGDERDAWAAACLLERSVHNHMTGRQTGDAEEKSALQAFQTRTGDCSEHAMLLTALCRAAGIPARVVYGKAYMGGVFGGHVWTEVFISDGWYALDGTLGLGYVGPTHIRFSSTSYRAGSIDYRFIAQLLRDCLQIEVLEFTRQGHTVKVDAEFKAYRIEGDTYHNTVFGIQLAKPRDYTFTDLDRPLKGMSFLLLGLEGIAKIELLAMPLPAFLAVDKYEELLKMPDEGVSILSKLARKIKGRPGCVYMFKVGTRLYRHLVFAASGNLYVLKMEIKDEERDILTFERLVKSIAFDE